MLTIKSIIGGVASITLDCDGTTYHWTVGALADVQDIPAHLEANADIYRQDIRNAKAMGRVLEPVVSPTLSDLKAQAIAQVKGATASLAEYLWPRLKAEAVRLAVPPFDTNTQAQYSAFVQETLAIQYEAAAAIEACETQEALAELLDDLRAMYGDSLGV